MKQSSKVVTKNIRNEKKKSPLAEKVLRDTFTIRQTDLETIKEIKRRCMRSDIDINKSLIVRAGIQILATLPAEKLKEIIIALPKVKVGRPKN